MLSQLTAWRDELAAAIIGIDDSAGRTDYAGLTLSRLLAVYLLQQQTFLDNNPTYLAHQLSRFRAINDASGEANADSAGSFFSCFLLPLFRRGLAAERLAGVDRHLLGAVPCFGSGLFAPQPVEQRNSTLQISDQSLEKVLNGLAALEWSLDESAAKPTVTPAVLGVFCEQHGRRQALGAHYTDQDVAAYIACSSIIPRLIDELALACPAVFASGGQIWQLLRKQPEHYLYADLRHGLDLQLPVEIVAGLNNVGARERWNRRAPHAYALPRETWREVVARRQRGNELRRQLAAGNLCCADDLVSANLDLGRLVVDVIASCDDLKALVGIYRSLERLAVLDPTCGAGAFLSAALAVLEPLFVSCLNRIAELQGSGSEGREAASGEVQQLLARAAASRGIRFFVRQSIIEQNLYGVDIMPEALAVARLRLQLLVLAVTPDPRDLDLASLKTRLAVGDTLAGDHPLSQKSSQATSSGYSAGSLALDNAVAWAALGPEALRRGGFDVVIGNPPYVLTGRASKQAFLQSYRTARCGNLYALVLERALDLLRTGGRCGMIVPIASVSTDAMGALQQLYAGLPQWHSHFAVRPARLFAGVDMNLTITLLHKQPGLERVFSTGYRRWSSGAHGERQVLFSTLAYCALPDLRDHTSQFPKLGNRQEVELLTQMLSHGRRLAAYSLDEGTTIYYHSGGRYWRKALRCKLSSHYKPFRVAPELEPIVLALLNSQLFYWYWITHSNCMDLVAREVRGLPVFALQAADPAPFRELVEVLLNGYQAASTTRSRRGRQIAGDELNVAVREVRPIISAIDRLLAAYYGFDAEQLDFLLNYDIKYRVATFESL